MRCNARAISRSSAGFTLIEVLVATAIAAILLLPLLRGFSAGLATTQRTAGTTQATLIAESTLESIGSTTPLKDGSGIERQNGPYRVTAAVHRYGADRQGQNPPVISYEVTVHVAWRDAGGPQSVALRTLRLAVPPETQNAGPPP